MGFLIRIDLQSQLDWEIAKHTFHIQHFKANAFVVVI